VKSPTQKTHDAAYAVYFRAMANCDAEPMTAGLAQNAEIAACATYFDAWVAHNVALAEATAAYKEEQSGKKTQNKIA